MIDLDQTYRQLARPWSQQQLAERYREADHRGAPIRQTPDDDLNRPVALLATAIPPSASMNVAVHVLHALPAGAQEDLAQQLVATTERNAADALHRWHHALELDGTAHDCSADEWLPVVCDAAALVLESANLSREPPTIVRAAQEAIGHLSHAVAELDQGSPEAPTALSDTVARLLTVWVFADAARDRCDR